MSINDKIDSVFAKEYLFKSPNLNARNFDPRRFLKNKNGLRKKAPNNQMYLINMVPQ